MSTAKQAFVILAFLRYVWGHGAVSRPSGRIFPPNANCPWCMGEHKPGSNPYGTVNRGERLSSPCMGSNRGDSTRSNWGPYANVAGEFDKPTYSAGQTFDANVVLDADHGGDAQWQICPHSQAETEECFTQNRLTDWKDVHCPFGRCDAGPHAFDRQSYTDYVKIPDNFPSGGATLRWLWVCKWTDEVFTSCIDVDIAGNSGTSVTTGNNNGGASSQSQNQVVENAPGVGGWGGSCTCPDGQVYQVGDNGDACGSLACNGGTSGTCSQSNGLWSHRSVTCHQPTSEPTPVPAPGPSSSSLGSSSTSLGSSSVEMEVHESAEANGDKVTLSFSPVGSDKMRFEVKVNRLGWVGFGISTGTQGLMIGGGLGTDSVICSEGQVNRYWLQSMSGPSDESSGDLEDASCSQANGYTTMTFTRDVAAANDMQRALTPGTPQPVVVAWGDGEDKIAYHAGRKGTKVVDFAGLDATDSLVSGAGIRDVSLTIVLTLCLVLLSVGS